MINKLGIYIACQACKRKMNEISQQKSLKCKNCGVRQRQAECKLLVHLDDKDVWLTAFTDVLESLFATHPTISLLSDPDTIEELLMDTKNIEFTYNMNRKVITKIPSSSLITGQTALLDSVLTTNFTKDHLIKTFSFVFYCPSSHC